MRRCAIGLFMLGGLAVSGTMAQEAMYTMAATMPSPHTGIVREQVHYWKFGSGPETEETERVEAMTSISYGLVRDWALTFDVPIEWRKVEDEDGSHDEDFGVEEFGLSVKWRFFKDDAGGVNTRRAAAVLGAEFPSGSNMSDDSVDPYIGAVYTQVWGRHGINQDVIFRLNTGGDDDDNFGGEGDAEALFFNSAYVYRVIPERYTPQTTGSYYVTAEINNIYETNGDFEMRFAPGFMYEGRRWAWEVMAQFPLHQDVDERPELDFGVGAGIRISF